MRWPIPQRPNHLYQNNSPAVGNTNYWLKVKLNGQASNRSGIGAKVRVQATIFGRTYWQEVVLLRLRRLFAATSDSPAAANGTLNT